MSVGFFKPLSKARGDRDWLPASANRLRAAFLLAITVMESRGSGCDRIPRFRGGHLYALITADDASLT